MPLVASNPPDLAGSLKSEPADALHFLRRDSRLVEYQTPIAEEDESTETASEPAEPVTPTSHNSDTTPFSNPFRHNDEQADSVFMTPTSNMKDMEAKPLPTSLAPPPPTREAPAPPAPVARTQSNLKANAQAGQQESTSEKPTPKFARARSFLHNKLHRTPSNKDDPNQFHDQSEKTSVQKEKLKPAPADRPKTEKLIVKTGVDGPAELSTPAVNLPKYRRLSSFSLSARNSPKSSQANSPPSPSSPSSTISNDQAHSESKLGHKHSTSSTALSSMGKQKGPGITWAGNAGRGGKRHGWPRRRSVSTEQVPTLDSDEEKATTDLLATFSKPAAQGVGMKARRLSLSLPDEFVVDSCELDKEFKSASRIPVKRGRIVGKGATADVRVYVRKGAGKEDFVAVKEFRAREKDESEGDYIKKIKSEYSIAKSLHHPNIVETVRLCTSRGRWNHVMEFCTHGELFSLVERKLFAGGQEGYYSPDDRLCFFKQLLRGVDYLHSHGIAHRDIKLENLLLSNDGHLKISDFGVAEVFSGEHPGLRVAGGECGKNMGEIRLSDPGICGSLPYIAPEVLEKNGSYDPRPLDVWSCAIVYLTMTFGGSPWQAAKPEFEYYARFKKGWDVWLQEHPDGKIVDGPEGHPKCGKLFSMINPPAIKRLMLKMLHPIPEKRITIRQVLDSPSVKSINCCCPESYEDPKCCVDASKGMQSVKATKKFLHHHLPPKPENKAAKVFTHRFDMGDGWA